MGKVIRLDDFRFPWKEVMTVDSDSTTLQVYVNERTGEAEVVQMNDEGEVIRTPLAPVDAQLLSAALGARQRSTGR